MIFHRLCAEKSHSYHRLWDVRCGQTTRVMEFIFKSHQTFKNKIQGQSSHVIHVWYYGNYYPIVFKQVDQVCRRIGSVVVHERHIFADIDIHCRVVDDSSVFVNDVGLRSTNSISQLNSRTTRQVNYISLARLDFISKVIYDGHVYSDKFWLESSRFAGMTSSRVRKIKDFPWRI